MARGGVTSGKPQINWQATLGDSLQAPVGAVQTRRIASLWAGYGSITQVTASTNTPGQPPQTHHLIAKQVDPPRGVGISHERKLRSYAVEAAFYTDCAPQLLAAGAACALPRPLLVESAPSSNHWFFVLSDLTRTFPQQVHSYSLEEAYAALDWLANFHAFWWERADPEQLGLWPVGCYWHLETRQEELRQIDGRWSPLRQCANDVDAALRGELPASAAAARRGREPGCGVRCMTLVHGDFKSANVLFNEAGDAAAAYDYQYVGGGYGVKDVVYMFASSVDEDVLQQHEEQLLSHYHTKLLEALTLRSGDSSSSGGGGGVGGSDSGRGGDSTATPTGVEAYPLEVLQLHYELALLDYARFMAGWGWWGNVTWAQGRARQLLPRLPTLLERQRRWLASG